MSLDYWRSLAFKNDVPCVAPGAPTTATSTLEPRRSLLPRNMHAVRVPEYPPRVLCRPQAAALVSLIHSQINSYNFVIDWLLSLTGAEISRYIHYASDEYLKRKMKYTFSYYGTYERGPGFRAEKTEDGYETRSIRGLSVGIVAFEPESNDAVPTSSRYKFKSGLISDEEFAAIERKLDSFPTENLPPINHLADLFVGKALSSLESDRHTTVVGMLLEPNFG